MQTASYTSTGNYQCWFQLFSSQGMNPTAWPLSRQCEIPWQFVALLPLLSVTYIMPVLVSLLVVGVGMQQCMIRNLNKMHKLSKVDANMQLTINSFRPLFPDKFFSLTFPWLLVKSMTFPWQLSIPWCFQVFQTSGHSDPRVCHEQPFKTAEAQLLKRINFQKQPQLSLYVFYLNLPFCVFFSVLPCPNNSQRDICYWLLVFAVMFCYHCNTMRNSCSVVMKLSG